MRPVNQRRRPVDRIVGMSGTSPFGAFLNPLLTSWKAKRGKPFAPEWRGWKKTFCDVWFSTPPIGGTEFESGALGEASRRNHEQISNGADLHIFERHREGAPAWPIPVSHRFNPSIGWIAV
jgi:hypothetical protein